MRAAAAAMSSLMLATLRLNTLIIKTNTCVVCCIEQALAYHTKRAIHNINNNNNNNNNYNNKRFKSTAAFLRINGSTDDETETTSSAKKFKPDLSDVKTLFGGEKSAKGKRLVSGEAPVLHHAKAAAVVDVRRNHTHTHTHTPSLQDIILHVDQLLKLSRKSIQTTKDIQPYEDMEYIERVGQNQTKPELVGALPPNALDWRPQKLDVTKLGSYYASLSKDRLTGLVVLTTLGGYAMGSAPLDITTLLSCSLGTGLVSAAANTINQIFEVPYDSQMDRTKNRILVRGLVTPVHAVCFATLCGTSGICMLYFGANGLAASLGAVNILLYTCIYTPMKRFTILNTWVGSVVGAIPPLIGWTSCTGSVDTGAWVMAGILYAWQFPHFNSLSWNLRPDYSRAGYRMMSVTNPGLCRRVALRYSVAMIGLCTLAPVIDVTTWTFAADSLPLNIYLTFLAWRFYKDSDSKSSRKLFMFTLIHLPAIMMLMIISKKHYGNKQTEETATNISNSEKNPTVKS